MTGTTSRLAERLEGEGKKTIDFFRQLSSEDWSRTVYTEGARWTVLEVLTHFVNAEASVYRLVLNIVDGGEGVPDDFDLDRYNERKVAQHQAKEIEALLADFADLRRRTMVLVQGFSAAELEKKGRHPFLGLARVEDIIKLMYRHNQIHQRDIRRQLKQIENE
jgi:hypothetical protein